MSISINSKKYKIVKELGQGGNGKVFQVTKDKQNYAIKKIPIEDLTEEEISDIENEAKILSSIQNEHIVKYYDSYKDKENFYILMEFCEGSDLKKFINEYKKKGKDKKISEKIVFTIVYDIYLGIKEIHEKNLIHRDLKPENLFISKDNRIKIGDFGISKQLDFNNKYAKTSIGTNNYMAPEVVKGEKYNKKVDLWAFGCIIYELLTLKVCFRSKSLYGFVDNILKNNPENIDSKFYNHKWQDLIDLLLKKDYKERPDIDGIYKMIMELNCEINSEKKGPRLNSKIFLIFIFIIVVVVGASCVGKTCLVNR